MTHDALELQQLPARNGEADLDKRARRNEAGRRDQYSAAGKVQGTALLLLTPAKANHHEVHWVPHEKAFFRLSIHGAHLQNSYSPASAAKRQKKQRAGKDYTLSESNSKDWGIGKPFQLTSDRGGLAPEAAGSHN